MGTSALTITTLRDCALAALARKLAPSEDNTPDELRVLLRARQGVEASHPDWLTGARACLVTPAPVDAPLVRLARELNLSLLELLTVALAAAVEEEPLVGRALAFLQHPASSSRPSLGLVSSAFAEAAPPGLFPLHALAHGTAVRSGLLSRSGTEAPLAEQTLAIPLPLYFALRGQEASWPGTTLGLGPYPEVLLPASHLDQVRRHADTLAAHPRSALLLRGGSTAELRTVAAALATTMGRRPLFLETDRTEALGPYLHLRSLLPVFCFDLGPGERKLVPSPPLYEGPVLLTSGPEGNLEWPEGSLLTWTLPVPGQQERRALWEVVLGDAPLAEHLASAHRHRPGRISQLSQLARRHAAVGGRPAPEARDLVAAAWSAEGAGLGSLAQAMPEPISDEALVANPPLAAELQALLLRCRSREGLAQGLGASATTRYRTGVTALLVGPSGTGKTLAAGWLATRLGMPLYRVDLASVSSKYIGETEKNLAQLFARAEHAEVMLLFDEADSLFGRRTDIRDSNDRFANAQTNYLLQRIESFDGVALLTSNSKGRFDPAFMRRLDSIIEFPMPGPEERRSLWLAHLGEGHRVAPKDLNRLAAMAELSGGHIRNAVLLAAVLARQEARPIEYTDLLRGFASEYKKLGRHVPAELRPAGN
ncbi:ATP-binding protein [Vitiosangium sp. GDMCC 1.1324]|uniref:ATP-binding protein n=1 Tax=Vitiosangium sp. (strain GDMCC 1.1324) TaxID=2138576 RepID=UPI000D37AFBA|nr:ATP-binding protein [Vitiosangium sp. GDMCC 1.1324]PTL85199.1 ATP-binding protein [Vitiosangium sp. GDMCC 1.1324]